MGAGGSRYGKLSNLLRILPQRLRYNRKISHIIAWDAPEKQACLMRSELSRVTTKGTTGNEVVVYLICLMGRSRANDWARVSFLLARTLKALQHQSDPHWQAVVCGQDKPDDFVDDSRIRFLHFEREPHEANPNDKNYKLERLSAYLESDGPETGYGFLLDADDVPHRDLTQFILGDNNGVGYLLDRGYMLADGTWFGRVLGHRSVRELRFENNTFFRNCGSCVAVFFDRRAGGIGQSLLREVLPLRHGQLPALTKLMGVRLSWVPFPAMCYIVLHGQNDYGGRAMPPRLPKKHLDYISEQFPAMDVAQE